MFYLARVGQGTVQVAVCLWRETDSRKDALFVAIARVDFIGIYGFLNDLLWYT